MSREHTQAREDARFQSEERRSEAIRATEESLDHRRTGHGLERRESRDDRHRMDEEPKGHERIESSRRIDTRRNAREEEDNARSQRIADTRRKLAERRLSRFVDKDFRESSRLETRSSHDTPRTDSIVRRQGETSERRNERTINDHKERIEDARRRLAELRESRIAPEYQIRAVNRREDSRRRQLSSQQPNEPLISRRTEEERTQDSSSSRAPEMSSIRRQPETSREHTVEDIRRQREISAERSEHKDQPSRRVESRRINDRSRHVLDDLISSECPALQRHTDHEERREMPVERISRQLNDNKAKEEDMRRADRSFNREERMLTKATEGQSGSVYM